MKVGLLVYTANARPENTPRRYETIRAVATQAEADGFDSIWLADHLLYRDADLWFPGLRPDKPGKFENLLTGTPAEIAAAMHGYAGLGVPHIMFQCVPFNEQSLQRLTEALHLYRGSARGD